MLSKDERAFTNPSLLRYTNGDLSNVNRAEVRSASSFRDNGSSRREILSNEDEINWDAKGVKLIYIRLSLSFFFVPLLLFCFSSPFFCFSLFLLATRQTIYSPSFVRSRIVGNVRANAIDISACVNMEELEKKVREKV